MSGASSDGGIITTSPEKSKSAAEHSSFGAVTVLLRFSCSCSYGWCGELGEAARLASLSPDGTSARTAGMGGSVGEVLAQELRSGLVAPWPLYGVRLVRNDSVILPQKKLFFTTIGYISTQAYVGVEERRRAMAGR